MQAAPLRDTFSLSAALIEMFRSPDFQPPVLPAVAVKILRAARKDDVSTREIVELLETDPTILSRVLRMAGSAMFGSLPVKTTHDALVRLGRRRVADIVVTIATSMTVFENSPYKVHMEALRRHSLTTAKVAEFVGRTAGVHDFAFLAGMMHDIGAAMSLFHFDDLECSPDDDLVWSNVQSAHTTCGSILVRLWGLPQEIEYAVRLHHQVEARGERNRLAAVVCIAEHLAHENGVDWRISECDRTDEEVLEIAKETLGFDASTYDSVAAHATAICQHVVDW